ncbi:MAG: RDD family protein [Microgenomates group bacterium]
MEEESSQTLNIPPAPTQTVSEFLQTPGEQTPPTQPPQPAPSQPPSPPSSQAVQQTYAFSVPLPEYASFWRRFFASSLDGVIISIVGALVGAIIGLTTGAASLGVSKESASFLSSFGSLISNGINLIISICYPVYFIGTRGQTPGKMALGIKVIKLGTNEAPGYMSAFLREVVGKLASFLIFGLGYLWMLWDNQKQTWHDKIAKTVVVKT